MKLKGLYLGLCIVGIVLPYSQLIPFLRENGLDLRLFLEQLFSNRVGSFFGMDVIVSSVVLWVLVVVEGRRAGVKHLWAPLRPTSPSASRWVCRCSSTCVRSDSRVRLELQGVVECV